MEYKSDILETIHENATANFEMGAISETRMREYDEMCLAEESKTSQKVENPGELEHMVLLQLRSFFKMRKTRAYRRSQRERTINRKVHILKQFGGETYVFAWSRGNTGRFAKGKIHCSCWMCRRKSYDILSHADRKKLMAVRQQMNERY